VVVVAVVCRVVRSGQGLSRHVAAQPLSVIAQAEPCRLDTVGTLNGVPDVLCHH
jgi:hypothetical protein